MNKAGVLLAILMLTLPSLSHAKQAPYPSTQEALEKEFQNLPWQIEPGTYQLSKSNSTLDLADGLGFLTGESAERYMYLSQGVEHVDVDAVVFDIEEYSQVIFSYTDPGYVSIDDWGEVNPDELLKEIIKNTEIGNKARQENGLAELRVTDWLVKPVLDKKNDAAYWAISLKEGERNIVNAITLKLGRSGFEKVVWVGETKQYSDSDNLLEAMLEGHSFNNGFRYADYSFGDKIAAFGIASLVATSAGGKSKAVKSTLAVIGLALLGILKKFIIIPIVLVIGGLWTLVKRPFSRKVQDD